MHGRCSGDPLVAPRPAPASNSGRSQRTRLVAGRAGEWDEEPYHVTYGIDVCEAHEVILTMCCRVAPGQPDHPTLNMVDNANLTAGRV